MTATVETLLLDPLVQVLDVVENPSPDLAEFRSLAGGPPAGERLGTEAEIDGRLLGVEMAATGPCRPGGRLSRSPIPFS